MKLIAAGSLAAFLSDDSIDPDRIADHNAQESLASHFLYADHQNGGDPNIYGEISRVRLNLIEGRTDRGYWYADYAVWDPNDAPAYLIGVGGSIGNSAIEFTLVPMSLWSK